MSLYGYIRDTTPNLAGWARKGVRYDRAMARAPWTFPSHSSFFTGQWPFRLNSQWKYTLDTSHSTVAEYLSSRNAYNDSLAYFSRIGSGARSDLSNADSWHPGGVNVTMGDGSVRFIKNSINISTWMSLGTRANGEVITADSY